MRSEQPSFTDVEYLNRRRISRREEFLAAMDSTVPWARWVALIEPFYYSGRKGRKPKPANGINHVFAPLRPTWKHKYPSVPMARYATWTRGDGLSIDPWIRTHQRMGARIVGPAPDSMVIPGTVAEWEQWAGMPLPESGLYIVPDALNMLEVDRKKDLAVYREENLWVQHR